MSQTKYDIAAFCHKHSISVEFHTKQVSQGCAGAIAERNKSPELIARGEKPTLSQELKTLLLTTNNGFLVAIHMPGDREVIPDSAVERGDHCRRYREFHKFRALSEALGSTVKITGWAKAIPGTLNPITLYLTSGDKVQHFFDNALEESGWYYTNTGDRVNGMKIRLQGLLNAIPHERVSVTIQLPGPPKTPVANGLHSQRALANRTPMGHQLF